MHRPYFATMEILRAGTEPATGVVVHAPPHFHRYSAGRPGYDPGTTVLETAIFPTKLPAY
jgi:hypothetical protein